MKCVSSHPLAKWDTGVFRLPAVYEDMEGGFRSLPDIMVRVFYINKDDSGLFVSINYPVS